jgi:ethylmalonyl-CoA mutase
MTVDPAVEAEQIERLKAWRAARDDKAVANGARRARAPRPRKAATSWSLDRLRQGRRHHRRMGRALREVFGEYRAPTGVGQAAQAATSAASTPSAPVDASRAKLGRRSSSWSASPGLDGHSNGAEQIAVRARDVGMEVVYEGIRLTPAEIVARRATKASTSSACRSCRAATCRWCGGDGAHAQAEGLDDVPVVVGGIIPPEDEQMLKAFGVAASTRRRTSS